MKTLNMTALLLAVWVAQPLTASEFLVLTAVGVRVPDGLQTGQELTESTRLELEPWGRALIRETTKCELTHFIFGVEEYVLKLADDCAETADPITVADRLQRGEAFSERLKETGSGRADALVQALSNEPCVFLERVSEEGTGSRECPSGYALRGLRCSGTFCDNKDLLCCPYLGGEPDPSTKTIQARRISEEFPNAMTSKRFLNGLSCTGPYCDNVLVQQFKSERLVNAGGCDWTAWFSDGPFRWLDCGDGRFMAGIRCQRDYCADVGVYCCQVRVE